MEKEKNEQGGGRVFGEPINLYISPYTCATSNHLKIILPFPRPMIEILC